MLGAGIPLLASPKIENRGSSSPPIDQTCTLMVVRSELRDPIRFRRYWMTAGLTIGVVWLATIAAAMLLGSLVASPGARDAAAPAVFIALLVPLLTSRPARAAAGAALVTATACHALPLGLAALAGTAAGVAAARLMRWQA